MSITHPQTHDKKTFWVDANTSLLRRFKREHDKFSAPDEDIKTYFSSEVHDFTINSAS